MSHNLEERYAIDVLADETGGYFALPSEDEMRYMDILFDVCKQFGISYYTATPKERSLVDEVTRLTWARQQEAITGVKLEVRPAFSA